MDDQFSNAEELDDYSYSDEDVEADWDDESECKPFLRGMRRKHFIKFWLIFERIFYYDEFY